MLGAAALTLVAFATRLNGNGGAGKSSWRLSDPAGDLASPPTTE
jgi:hypothetical protein